VCGNRRYVLTWLCVGCDVVGAVVRGFLVLGVVVCAGFTVLHGLWASGVVVRLADG